MTTRVDNATIRLDKLKPDENGFLRLNNVLATRAGVFKYTNTQGNVVRELRPRDEVFNDESMKTLAMKPFSVEHKGGLLTSDTVKEFEAGHTGENVSQEGKFVKIAVSITRKDAVDKILKLGHLDVSAGYTCDIEETSGNDTEFGKYDRIQRNIRYNHLTSTAKGRGEGCSIRLDAWMVDDQKEQPPNTKEITMLKTKIQPYSIGDKRFDSFEINVPDEAGANVEMLHSKLEEVTLEANSQIAKMEAKLDSLESRASENTEEAIMAKAKELAGTMFKEKLETQEVLLVAEKKLDSDVFASVKGESMDEIKKAILKASGRYKEEKFDTAGYVDAGYDQILSEGPSKKAGRFDYEDPRSNESMSESQYLQSLIAPKGA